MTISTFIILLISGIFTLGYIAFLTWLFRIVFSSIKSTRGKKNLEKGPIIGAYAVAIFLGLTILYICGAFIFCLYVFIPQSKSLFLLNGKNNIVHSYDKIERFVVEYAKGTFACSINTGGDIQIKGSELLPTKCNSDYVLKREISVKTIPITKEYKNKTINITGLFNDYLTDYSFLKYSVNTTDNCMENIIAKGSFDGETIEFTDTLKSKDKKKYYLFIWIDEDEMDNYKEITDFTIKTDIDCTAN